MTSKSILIALFGMFSLGGAAIAANGGPRTTAEVAGISARANTQISGAHTQGSNVRKAYAELSETLNLSPAQEALLKEMLISKKESKSAKTVHTSDPAMYFYIFAQP